MNRVAMIVSAGSAREATRYISSLPGTCAVWLHAPTAEAAAVRREAKPRFIQVQLCSTPHDTVRLAEIVHVFGKNPFGEHDMEILASQGIPVEIARQHHAAGSRGKKS